MKTFNINFSRVKAAAMLAVFILFTAVLGFSGTQESGRIFQASTIKALMEGVFDGQLTIGDLKAEGDFGIGTFEGLDGEMVLLNGVCYRVKTDGAAYEADDTELTPFAAVSFFKSDNTLQADEPMDYSQLQKYIDMYLPTKNIMYMIKIKGTFSHVKTRSVAKYEKPYPTLYRAVKNQKVFDFRDVKGTLVGFWFPKYMNGVNMAGYHLHFISDDRKAGGHLLDCTLDKGVIEIGNANIFHMELPEEGHFWDVDLTKDKDAELKKVESK
ncbi:MAG: acetolactate decarboxylase [Candidatus Omnitrophica bacterium]|nr:acetolactate decarboxylase [Candidatus Omnitrophota bacterium]